MSIDVPAIKTELVSNIDPSLQLQVFQIVQSADFDQVWRRAVILETVSADETLITGTARQDALNTLIYAQEPVLPDKIPEINVAKIVGTATGRVV